MQGAGKSIQSAWSTQSFGPNGGNENYFRLSGR